jgi:hypothetical protein
MNTAKKNTSTRPDIEYSTVQVWFNNVPYIVTVILGASIVWHSWNIAFSLLFVIYGAIGTVWFIVFICPRCGFHATKACPCGYGIISAMFVRRKNSSQFNRAFLRNVPVLFPIWVVPIYAGVRGMMRSFSPMSLIMLVMFIVISWVVLPLVSKRHGCLYCPNRDQCPWMGKTSAVYEKGKP